MKNQYKDFNLNTDIQDTPLLPKVKTALINNGFLTLDHLTSLTKKELKGVKGVGELGFASIQLFLHEIGLTLKKEERKKDDLLGFKRFLILKFLKDTNNINWPAEMRAAKLVLNKYPNLEFWKSFELSFKLNSLFFFLTKNGEECLAKPKQKKQQVPVYKEQRHKLSENKIGDDIVSHKPKTVKDFLNGA